MSTLKRSFPAPAHQVGFDRESLPFSGKEELLMKSRIKQRANRKMKEQEARLEKRNHYGNKDLTAYNAVQQIRTNGKAEIALR
jgi:hypothetical protein